jgi:hypothetical protein
MPEPSPGITRRRGPLQVDEALNRVIQSLGRLVPASELLAAALFATVEELRLAVFDKFHDFSGDQCGLQLWCQMIAPSECSQLSIPKVRQQ